MECRASSRAFCHDNIVGRFAPAGQDPKRKDGVPRLTGIFGAERLSDKKYSWAHSIRRCAAVHICLLLSDINRPEEREADDPFRREREKW